MKKTFLKWAVMSFAAIVAVSLGSCSDDNDNVPDDEDDEIEEVGYQQPTEDIVKTQYTGKVAVVQPISDAILDYLNKRFVNTTTELTEDADVVVMDELNAGNLAHDEEQYALLQKIWDKNKVFVFINPDANAYSLESKLRNNGVEFPPSNDDLASLEGVSIYMTRADGNSFYHEGSGMNGKGEEEDTYTAETEEGVTNVTYPPSNDEFVPTDYTNGVIAENAAEWLNEISTPGEQRNIAFARAASDAHNAIPVSTTIHHTIKTDHSWIKSEQSKANVPASVEVDVKTVITAYGAYSPAEGGDIYDITLYQGFPADKTFVKNKVVLKKAAYKYKYTGGCYYGPYVDLSLVGLPSGYTVELEEVAPLPQAGQYNLTHYPLQTSLGGSLQGNISKDPGLSLGFSGSCTLPFTTISFNHSEMPINFQEKNGHAQWIYSTNYKIYKGAWGFNPQMNDIPDIVHQYCKTDQAVSFVVKNTEEMGECDIRLRYNIRYEFYDEFAWYKKFVSHNRRIKYYDMFLTMPKVNRKFERFLPSILNGFSPDEEKKSDYISYWNNLQTLLMNNVNYRALCDETLTVGAQTEEGLTENATKIWRQALEGIIKQYGQMNTTYSYAVVLNDSNGAHLPIALTIKNGKWSIVENIDQ